MQHADLVFRLFGGRIWRRFCVYVSECVCDCLLLVIVAFRAVKYEYYSTVWHAE